MCNLLTFLPSEIETGTGRWTQSNALEHELG
jgi:hypothetical protein